MSLPVRHVRKRSGGILGAAAVLAAGLALPTSASAGAGQAPAAGPEPGAVLGSAAWASVQARRTGVQVPVPALTTKTSTTVADPQRRVPTVDLDHPATGSHGRRVGRR